MAWEVVLQSSSSINARILLQYVSTLSKRKDTYWVINHTAIVGLPRHVHLK